MTVTQIYTSVGKTETLIPLRISTGRVKIVTTVMWLGLSDISIEGNWAWSDQSPLTYLNWRDGEFY